MADRRAEGSCNRFQARLNASSTADKQTLGHTHCLHPGVVATSFGKNAGRWIASLSTLASPFMLTPRQGARTSVFLASASKVERVTGNYFVKSRVHKSSPASHNQALQEQVWHTALNETGSEDLPSRHPLTSSTP